MKKYYFLMIVLVVVYCSVNAQFNDNYELLRCSGAVPKDWQNSINQKFEEKKVEDKEKNKEERGQKEKNVFYLKSSFSIDNLLRSGWVLYNDPITAYLEAIKEELQKKNPEIPKDIRIYTLRIPEVNAFSTDEGIIFVTMGLIAKVNNEAELALIIGHEIGHVMKQHSLNKYLEIRKIDKKNSSLVQKNTYEKKILKFHAYSRENETEADRIGLNLVLNTQYATATLENVYEMLRLAKIPFLDTEFPLEMLETEFMKIKPYVSLRPIKPIKGIDAMENDSMHTHPNIATRKKVLRDRLLSVKKEAGFPFLVSEETFKKVQLMARFEVPMAYIDGEQFEEALYISACLLKNYPNNIYLKKTFAKALYKIAKNNLTPQKQETQDEFTTLVEKENIEDIEGAMSQVYELCKNMPKKDWHIIATSYIWNLKQDYPKEEEIAFMCKDLMIDMHDYITDRTFFQGFDAWVAEKNNAEIPEVKPTENIIKEDKKKNKKKKVNRSVDKEVADKGQELKEKESFLKVNNEQVKYAFLEYVDDKAFIQLMEEARESKKEREKSIKYMKSYSYMLKLSSQMHIGQKLGLDTVIMLSPVYVSYNSNMYLKSKDDVLESEMKQIRMNEIIKTQAQNLGLNATLLGEKNLKEEDTELFNDYIMIKRWLYESVSSSQWNVVPMYHDELMKISQKYNTSRFVYTQIFSLFNNNPYSISGAANYTAILSIVFDFKTGEIIPIKSKVLNTKDRLPVIKAHTYDILLQLHKKK